VSVYRRSGATLWTYDFELFKQRYTSHGFATKDDAEEAEAHKKRTLRRRAAGLEALDAKDTPRFSDWAAVTLKYQTTRKKLKRPTEAKNTLRMVLAFWGYAPREKPVAGGPYKDLRLGDPIQRPELIEEFETWMDTRTLSGARKNHYRSACSMIYRVALLPANRKRSGVRENPFAGVLRDRVQRRTAVLELEDAERWLQTAPLPVAIGVGLALLSPALRLRNVVDLTRSQVSRDLTTLTVPHKTDRETGLPLTVSISPGLRRVLKQVFERWPDDDYVVPLEGERYWQFVKLVKRSVVAAGLPYGRKLADGITFHSLRHAVQTWLARWKVSREARQQALGHQTAAMTDWYTHLAGIQMAPTMLLLDRRLPVAARLEARLAAEVPSKESAANRLKSRRKPVSA
jgi:integrase